MYVRSNVKCDSTKILQEKKNQGINPIFYLKNALEERFLKG